MEYVSEEMLLSAKHMLVEAFESILQEKLMVALENDIQVSPGDDLEDKLTVESINRSVFCTTDMYVNADGTNGWVTTSEGSNKDVISAIKTEFFAVKEVSDAIRKKADKLESKLTIKNGGYAKRADVLRDEILQYFAEYHHSKIELDVFSMLLRHERQGISNRIRKFEGEIKELEAGEASLQKRYGDLLHEKNRLLIRLRQRQQLDSV